MTDLSLRENPQRVGNSAGTWRTSQMTRHRRQGQQESNPIMISTRSASLRPDECKTDFAKSQPILKNLVSSESQHRRPSCAIVEGSEFSRGVPESGCIGCHQVTADRFSRTVIHGTADREKKNTVPRKANIRRHHVFSVGNQNCFVECVHRFVSRSSNRHFLNVASAD